MVGCDVMIIVLSAMTATGEMRPCVGDLTGRTMAMLTEHHAQVIQHKPNEQIRVGWKTFHNKKLLDIRVYWRPEHEDEYVPTKRGVTIREEELVAFLEALKRTPLPLQ